jgi:hypothetical protein
VIFTIIAIVHQSEPLVFILFQFALPLLILAGVMLWYLRYQRKWRQFRARNWAEVQGSLDEGEVVTMFRGRTKTIAGYQVWFGYDYEGSGDDLDLFVLPFFGEFHTKEEAEACRQSLAHRSVPVRVSPRKRKRSRILDRDVMPTLMNTPYRSP